MACNQSEYFRLYFGELERRGIEYVILHSYQEYPEKIPSDIDYAVAGEYLAKLPAIQAEVARKNGWALAQTLQHGVFAYYSVLLNLDQPEENIRLDACSNYARIRRLLVPEKILLTGRTRFRDFYIPAPAAEFAYVLAKMFDAKKKSPANYLPRFRELYAKDPAGTQKNFTDLFGDTGKTLEQWLASGPEEWRRLGPILFARKKFGPALLLRDASRLAKRIFYPTGLCLAVIGPESATKSSLIAGLQTLLEPCFRYQPRLFRPSAFEKISSDRAPKNIVSSWLSAAYFFASYWMAWLRVVIPAKILSQLVILDKSFDDLLVDPKSYRLQGAHGLVRLLRHFLPLADRTFLLAQASSAGEMDQTATALKQLAQENPAHYTVVDAAQPTDQMVRTAWREVVTNLAAKEDKRTE